MDYLRDIKVAASKAANGASATISFHLHRTSVGASQGYFLAALTAHSKGAREAKITEQKGKIIVIEGLDGCGKATQTAAVCALLQKENRHVRQLTFPDYSSPSSALVKMYLGGEFSSAPNGVNAYAASSFYAVDRYASFVKDWKSDYDNACLFIADRYTTSNAIYQLPKLPESEYDTFLRWLDDYEYTKLSIPRPTAVIYLDMPIDVSQSLMRDRCDMTNTTMDIHERNTAFLSECRKSALYTAGKQGWHILNCCDDNTPRPIDDITADIMEIIYKCI